MANKPKSRLYDEAVDVLKANDRGNYTQPASDLYPHQWLWDSAFISIGLRHLDVERAKLEIRSLIRGQWQNGMLPCIIFRDDPKYRPARDQWRSWISPYAPDDVTTAGITQPPMVAEAVVKIGSKMQWPERRQWYKLMLPALVDYHQWLYAERDPHHEGLVLQIHPWETGLDNSPPWMSELHEHLMPLWIRLVEKLKLDYIVKLLRTDTKKVPLDERTSVSESLAMFDTQLRLRRKAYDINKILDHSLFSIEDLSFNCIFIRANEHLVAMAKAIKADLPEELLQNMHKTRSALEELWDPITAQYYCRDFVTHRLLKTSSVSTLLPLYAGCITKDRAAQLVTLLENEHLFGTAYPVPTVPPESTWFNPHRYWQGPAWVNTNWLIIDGLRRYGFSEHADAIASSTIEMVEKSGFYEYFDPLDGSGLSINNFSWTAALIIDLLEA